MNVENFNKWYEENSPLYDSLAQAVVQILKSILRSECISYVDIPYRLKAKESCSIKFEKKASYNSFEDMTDIAALRVITLVESDLAKVSQIISENFNVHTGDSGNKADLLGSDKFGYRSIHFICDIGKSRENLPEFNLFKGLCFEVQIRTALSHAWAEIEHDRGYKLSGELPTHLKRRFNLLSGLLESADLEFNRLTEEIEAYKLKIKSSDINDLLDLDINKLSLINYLNIKFQEKNLNPEVYAIESFNDEQNLLYSTLRSLGLNKIGDIDKIWVQNVEKINEDWDGFVSLSAPLFRVLLIYDLNGFLNTYLKIGLDNIRQEEYVILQRYFDKEKLDNLMKNLNLKVNKKCP